MMDEKALLENFVKYALQYIDHDGMGLSHWELTCKSAIIKPEQLEMAHAFLSFLKGKYIIQVNYKDCRANPTRHPRYKMRDRNKTRLKDELRRTKLIDDFLKVYNDF